MLATFVAFFLAKKNKKKKNKTKKLNERRRNVNEKREYNAAIRINLLTRRIIIFFSDSS